MHVGIPGIGMCKEDQFYQLLIWFIGLIGGRLIHALVLWLKTKQNEKIYLMHVNMIGMCQKVQFDQAHLLE